MLLKRLIEYQERPGQAEHRLPAMYQEMPIRWIIHLNRDGQFQYFSTQSGGGKKDRGKATPAPHIGRTVAIQPKLLADNGEYVLGRARPPKPGESADKKQQRVEQCHDAFVDLVRRCAEATGVPEVTAVLRFLETQNLGALNLPEEFDPTENITFEVEEIRPIDLNAVQQFWARITGAVHEDTLASEQTRGQECMVCGQIRPIAERHPILIKGIPGGKSSGNALISANAPAFESYGLEASTIAPTCHTCAEAYAKAANELLGQRKTHLKVGPLAYIFWTRADVEFASFLYEPEAEQVRELLASPRTGKEQRAIEDASFHAAALSASGARIMVRDWLDTTISKAMHSLARYFRFQNIVQWDGSEGSPLALYPLAASLYHDAHKDMVAEVPRALMRLALHGTPLPFQLLVQAVQRNRADQGLSRPRAALIKMVLLSRNLLGEREEEDQMTRLDPTREEPAYHCGRLLAELEALQEVAIGANATIVDRYYGTASTAPASVFGNLMRNAQNHLAKLRKNEQRKGAYEAIEKRLEEIQGSLSDYPKLLRPQQQALFALGYYHQRAYQRGQREAASARKKAAQQQALEPAAV